MPRMCKPSIAPIVNRGREYFRISYPTASGRKREIYSTQKKAQARLRVVLADAHRFGATADAVTAHQRSDAAAALEILAGRGTLVEAARFFTADIERRAGGKKITDVVAAFLASRSGFSELYRKNCEGWGKKICASFPDATTADLTEADCQDWIDGLAGLFAPATVEIGKKMLGAVLTFAVDRKWATSNPASKAVLPPAKTADPKIISPMDLSMLLIMLPDELIPAAVLAGFCGLRRAEINQLDWRAVNLAQGTVTIGSGIAKTSSRRVCPVPENAKAWLATHAQQSGNVLGEGMDTALELFCRALSFPKNALRHSAISYKLALTPDLPRVAYESGNSPKVVQRHYNGLAEEGDALLYFSIAPDPEK